MIKLSQAVELVWGAFADMEGGEIYVRKIPSMNIIDIALAVAPQARHEIIGIRPGEKLHEQMIGLEDVPFTYEYENYYKILPAIHDWASDPTRIKSGIRVSDDFVYTSDRNKERMSVVELASWIQENRDSLSTI